MGMVSVASMAARIVAVDGVDDLRYSIDRNKLRVYSASYRLPAESSVKVLPGLRDSAGERLAVPVAASVKAASQLPQARFLGSGVIVPTSQGYTVPIETMNLRGVIVEAYKIPSSSMARPIIALRLSNFFTTVA